VDTENKGRGVIKMRKNFRWLQRELLKFGSVFVVTTLLVLGTSVNHGRLIATRTQPNGNLFDSRGLPDDDVAKQENAKFEFLIEPSSVIIIEVTPPTTVWSEDFMELIVELSNECEKLPQVKWVKGLSNIPNPKNVGEKGNRTLLLDNYLSEIPVGTDELKQLKKDVEKNPMVYKRVMFGEMALIILGVEPSTDEIQFISELTEILAKFQGPEDKNLTGLMAMNKFIRDVIDGYLGDNIPLLAILVTLIMLIFGGFRLIFLVLYLIGMTVLWNKGFERLLDVPLNVLTAVVVPCLFAIMTSYPVHVVEELSTLDDDFYDKEIIKDRIADAMARVIVPITVAATTTIIGFGCLGGIRLASITEFGLDVCIGVVSGWLILVTTFAPIVYLMFLANKVMKRYAVTRTFVYLISLPRMLVDRILDLALARFASFCMKPGWVVLIFVTLILLALPGVRQVQVGSDTNGYFPEGHQIPTTGKHLRGLSKGDGGFYIVVNRISGEKGLITPKTMRKIRRFQDKINSDDRIGYTHSVVDEWMYLFMVSMDNDYETYKHLFDDRFLPYHQATLSQYQMIFGSGLSKELVDDPADPYAIAIFVWLDCSRSPKVEDVYEQIRRDADSVFGDDETIEVLAGGEFLLWLANERYFLIGKIRSLSIALLLIGVFGGSVFSLTNIVRRWKSRKGNCKFVVGQLTEVLVVGLMTAVPTLVITWALFGVLGYMGVLMNIAITVNSVVALGIGADFAIHFEDYFKNELEKCRTIQDATRNTIVGEGRRLVKDALTNVAVFGYLVTAPIAPMMEFGLMISLVMVACPVTTMMILTTFFNCLGPLRKMYTHNSA